MTKPAAITSSPMRYDYSYFIREGIRGIFLHGFMSFAAVGVIVACLLIMGSFTLLAINIDGMVSGLEDQNKIMAFVDETLTLEQARELESGLETVGNVSSVEFISNEQAFNDYAEKVGRDALIGIDKDTFRHRYLVSMDDVSLMNETVESIRAVPGVADVNAREDIAQGFINVRHIVNLVSITLIVVLLGISVFIISNTIKLATFDRREEIAIMKMVGATNAFIRWPFVVEGLLLGLIGSVIAYFLQWMLYSYVTSNDYLNNAMGVVPFGELSGWIVLIFIVTGFMVGVGGSVLTIRKFLRV